MLAEVSEPTHFQDKNSTEYTENTENVPMDVDEQQVDCETFGEKFWFLITLVCLRTEFSNGKSRTLLSGWIHLTAGFSGLWWGTWILGKNWNFPMGIALGLSASYFLLSGISQIWPTTNEGWQVWLEVCEKTAQALVLLSLSVPYLDTALEWVLSFILCAFSLHQLLLYSIAEPKQNLSGVVITSIKDLLTFLQNIVAPELSNRNWLVLAYSCLIVIQLGFHMHFDWIWILVVILGVIMVLSSSVVTSRLCLPSTKWIDVSDISQFNMAICVYLIICLSIMY